MAVGAGVKRGASQQPRLAGRVSVSGVEFRNVDTTALDGRRLPPRRCPPARLAFARTSQSGSLLRERFLRTPIGSATQTSMRVADREQTTGRREVLKGKFCGRLAALARRGCIDASRSAHAPRAAPNARRARISVRPPARAHRSRAILQRTHRSKPPPRLADRPDSQTAQSRRPPESQTAQSRSRATSHASVPSAQTQQVTDRQCRRANLTRPPRQISIIPCGALQEQNPARPAGPALNPRTPRGGATA